MALITLIDAHLAYGDLPLLDEANISIEPGERVGLIGRNGTGKSSLLSVLAGKTMLDDGQLQRMDGLTIHYVEQEPQLPDAPTLKESLILRGKLDETTDEREKWRILAKLDENLSHFELNPNADPKLTSGGEKKRAALALAFTLAPQLLLLDEPTSGLDPVVRDEVLDLLYDFMQDENHAILLSSHITSDLDKIADEITFIHKGEVLLSEPRDELLDTCGILRCTADQLDALDPSAVRAKRVGAFGCEALVRRDGVPENWSVEPVNIEQIMLFLTRGEDAR